MVENNIEKKFNEFMKENNIEKVISFSGGSDKKEEDVRNIIESSLNQLKIYNVAILSGGTTWGVPRFATQIAKENNLKTIGVLPSRGIKNKIPNLDLELIIEAKIMNSDYGDESEVFSKISNGIITIGGSNGTAIEFYHAMKINDRRIRDGEEPIYIAPIATIEGFSSEIYKLNSIKNKDLILPKRKLFDGDTAARYLIEKLNLRK
ncbi:MAG: hypothetical protein KC550_03700 [Nanoarchaeota archaeon]|nr:hypothetical protein [Nanoarchaeota archaeon]